ncbi:MAG: aminotransferase class I/II-fold pyridoxal phosphate-dependent enzyme [Sphingobacteriales bacterium]|nr:MAG: aminotransferase class I/II-fold pyridoxal phosphate-dependent enzyme [Sphingobacteriales bacterium]
MIRCTPIPEYDKKITINSLSKSYGLPGLRIGWVKAEAQIIEGLINIRPYKWTANTNKYLIATSLKCAQM